MSHLTTIHLNPKSSFNFEEEKQLNLNKKHSISNGNLRANCLSLPLMSSNFELVKWENCGENDFQNGPLRQSFTSSQIITPTKWLFCCCCFIDKMNKLSSSTRRSCESSCVIPSNLLTHSNVFPSSSTTLEDNIYLCGDSINNNNKLFVQQNNKIQLKKLGNYLLYTRSIILNIWVQHDKAVLGISKHLLEV